MMDSNLDTLAGQVKTNLLYYNLWKSVEEIRCSDRTVAVSGYPPEKLDSLDESNRKEWVLPREMHEKLTIETIEGWFDDIKNFNKGMRPSRITVGLVNHDGTIVYYFIHDGIVKPRQN